MYIKIITKDNIKKVYNILSNQITIGRSTNNSISIPDSKISRNHLLIVRDGNILRVKDLGSTNGTYIGGKRIQPQLFYTVGSNSNIKIGRTVLILESSGFREVSESKTEVDNIGHNYPIAERGRERYYHQHNISQYTPHKGLGSEIEYGIHASKSFVGPAWLTFFLYYIGLYIGGVIANILFINSVKTTKRIINRDPPGTGCLWFLIWTHVFLPLIAGAIFLILLAFGVFSFM